MGIRRYLLLCGPFVIAAMSLAQVDSTSRHAARSSSRSSQKTRDKREARPTAEFAHILTPPAMRTTELLHDSGVSAFTARIPEDPIGIGEGFNASTDEPGAKCVAYDPDADDLYVEEPGQKTIYDLKQITSYDDLKQQSNVDASAEFGFGLFSASGGTQFVTAGHYSQYSDYLWLNVEVTNATCKLKHMKLNDVGLKYAKQGSAAFVQSCGNEFVYAKQTGGRLTAIVEFESDSQEEHEKVSASLKASLFGFGGAAADFSKALDQIKGIARTHIHLLHYGGTGSLPDIGTLKDAALKFPATVAAPAASSCRGRESRGGASTNEASTDASGHPVAFALLTRSYTNVENYPPGPARSQLD